MMAYVQENGLSFAPPTWEVYLNDPSEVPEEQLLTEIYQALA
jgi:effector-binding domain-containing protein